MGNIHEPQAGVDVTNVPTEGQTQTLRRHSDPIILPRTRNVDDDGRNEGEAPDNAMADDEDDHTRQRDTQENVTQLRVGVTADVGPPTTPTANRVDEISEDNPEDELEPWVDCTTRATHKADDLLAASGITSWILRFTGGRQG